MNYLLNRRMIFNIFIFLTALFSFNVYAACDDQPANEVDWTNCNFIEQLDLSGVALASAQMSGVNLALANLEKSQINNARKSRRTHLGICGQKLL